MVRLHAMHFFYIIRSWSDMSKLRTEPTKIGHIFRQESFLKIRIWRSLTSLGNSDNDMMQWKNPTRYLCASHAFMSNSNKKSWKWVYLQSLMKYILGYMLMMLNAPSINEIQSQFLVWPLCSSVAFIFSWCIRLVLILLVFYVVHCKHSKCTKVYVVPILVHTPYGTRPSDYSVVISSSWIFPRLSQAELKVFLVESSRFGAFHFSSWNFPSWQIFGPC